MIYRQFLPLAAAAMLAACGSSQPTEIADSSGKVSEAKAAEAIAKVDAPEPGLYKTKFELLDFSMPGMPAGMMDQMKQRYATAQDTTHCQKETDPEAIAKKMAEGFDKGNCTYDTFQVSRSTVNMAMTCNSPGGTVGKYTITGTLSSTGSDMMMQMDQQAKGGGIGSMKMKAHLVTTRVGPCPG